MIYHITTPAAWADALEQGQVVADSLATEGFMHCSRSGQLLNVANRFFCGALDLLVLAIDEDGVGDRLVDEAPIGSDDPFAQERFPHVYGPIPVSAVVAAEALLAGGDGTFSWPQGLPKL